MLKTKAKDLLLIGKFENEEDTHTHTHTHTKFLIIRANRCKANLRSYKNTFLISKITKKSNRLISHRTKNITQIFLTHETC